MMWVFEEFYLQNAVLQSLNATFLVLIPKKEGANDIRKGWEEFILRTSIRIGNGRHMGFWWDNWVGDSKLKDIFLLYSGLQPTNLLQCRPFEEARGWRWLLEGAF